MKPKTKNRKVLETIIKVIVSVAALYFVFNQIEFKEIKEVFLSAKFVFLIPALLFFIFSKILSAIRLNLFFRQIGVKITEISNLKLYWTGMFYNMFLPGGIGGDGYKVYLLSQNHDTKVKNLLWIVFLDRLTGMVALGMITLILWGFSDLKANISYLIWSAVFTGFFVLFLIVKKYQPLIYGIFFRVFMLSTMVQIMQIISVIFILHSLGFSENLLGYITIFLISSIVSIIPLTIGGAGARELTFLYGSEWMNLQTDISIALSLTFYLITLITSLAGIFWAIQPASYLLHKKTTMN
ncbi:MAG: lysylphosphatidylglycerol synthase transmembrane domain-containing protein [Bacteroidota bacterium]